ncbi:hypothetical protein P4N68_07995 [Corynebacterium felinum]|uniref:Secreted protein n=1 Tax=Corynebacterium felinum TaxID=131318 RepID=A0ABU2BCZ4_9CORY|nr:hypothetical protein [Corynebacterium felinum]MDF5821020.1 hypothetical protein [Corynebacterium felinum]MDR7356226.1 hypothetical protein [Corynebacterium felinum]WJY95558.1 hypothetical protein CFELI_09780 [Corynebacterium felinum]
MTFARKIAAVAIAAGLAFSAQPAALAKDVKMPFPLGGTHTVNFHGNTVCHWPGGKGNSPVEQRFFVSAMDKDADPKQNLIYSFLPFNSAEVTWKNTTTGTTGSQVVRSNGREVAVNDIDTGIGNIEATYTVTRSLFPTLSPGSSFPWFSVTHTETITAPAINPVACENAPG